MTDPTAEWPATPREHAIDVAIAEFDATPTLHEDFDAWRAAVDAASETAARIAEDCR